MIFVDTYYIATLKGNNSEFSYYNFNLAGMKLHNFSQAQLRVGVGTILM